MTAIPDNSRRLPIAIAVACLAAPGLSAAFDFTWTPTARTMMRLDDNIRSSEVDAQEALGFDVGGGVRLKAQSEELTSEIFPRFNLRRFAVGEDLDADEYSVHFNNDWVQERYATGLDFSYDRDSTLRSEARDTGLVNDVTERDTITVQPSASYFLTDRIALQSAFTFTDVAYVDATDSSLSDYDYLQGSAGFNYRWREDVTAFANVFVSEFTVPRLESKTRSYGGQGGMTWRWDETLDMTGILGWIASDIEFEDQQLALVADPLPRLVVIQAPGEASTAGPIATVNIRKTFDTAVASFRYIRQVSPSGRGSQSTTDRIVLVGQKELSSLLGLRLEGIHDMRAAESEGTLGLRGRPLNRDYSEVRGILRYRLSPEWSVQAIYRHARRQDNADFSTASAVHTNAIFVTLDYNGLPKTLWSGF